MHHNGVLTAENGGVTKSAAFRKRHANMHDYSIGFWREGSGVRHEQHCMKVAVAAPSCMPSSSEYRKTRQGDHVATQQQQNGNWSAGK